METSQVSGKRNSINFCAADALHLEMSVQGPLWSSQGSRWNDPIFTLVSPSGRITQRHGIWPWGLLKVKICLKGNGCDEHEQILTSYRIYLWRTKGWAPNSTAKTHRDETQSDRVLSAKVEPRDPSLTQGMASYNLKRGRRGTKGSLFRFQELYRCPASRMRQATAVMRAAPFPLPSSDSRKDTSHFGARSFTVACMTLAKLEKLGGRHRKNTLVMSDLCPQRWDSMKWSWKPKNN